MLQKLIMAKPTGMNQGAVAMGGEQIPSLITVSLVDRFRALLNSIDVVNGSCKNNLQRILPSETA